MNSQLTLRKAVGGDVAGLKALIEKSVRELQAEDYTPRQLELALLKVYGVDSQLIEDGTYFVVESNGSMVACGGWSKRKTLFGGDVWVGREDSLLDPKKDAAKIRAFFVHPEWVRRGIGGMILGACENAAMAAGFRRLEMGATLTGVEFYRVKGYAEIERLAVPLGDGEELPIVRMGKSV